MEKILFQFTVRMGGEVSKETSTHPNSFPVYSISDNYLLPSTLDFCSESQAHQENLSPSKKSELSSYAKNNLKSLDPGFEDEILECEMELEKDNISFENLAKLVDLYMEAMSFYEAQQCQKYKYYANQLQTLMLKPKIDEVMAKESFGEESAKDDKELRMSRLNSGASQTEGDLNPQKLKLFRRLTSRKRTSTVLTQSTAYGSSEVLSRGDEERDLDSSYREDNLMQIIEIDECGKKESDDENIEGRKERNRRRTYSACLSSQLSKSGFKNLSMSANKVHSLEMENLSAKAYNKILFSLKQ